MFEYLKLIDRKKAVAIFVLGLISGLMNFLFLGFINMMIGKVLAKENTIDIIYIILFVALMLGFMWSRRSLSFIIIKFSQEVFWKLRATVLNTILNASYFQVERRKDQIHACLIQDVSVLTGFSMSVINFMSAIVMTIGCFAYMGMESVPLMFITLGVAVAGIVIYLIGVRINGKLFEVARNLEDSFMKSFLDILSGFKEIHMNPKIGKDIYNQKIKKISSDAYVSETKAVTSFLNIQITGEVLFYILIAFILIFYTFFAKESTSSIISFVFILLYLLGSLNTIMITIPEVVQARISSNKINALKRDLKDARFENVPETAPISQEGFRDIIVEGMSFNYEADTEGNSFKIGPIDVSFKKGEAVFLYGGNGSGKTTMINVLLGILKHNSGGLKYNGIELSPENYGNYRSLFSVVFSDFHLFEEFYGLEKIDLDLINEYLVMFEIDHKVTVEKRSFSSQELSTGQRKRLALINALIQKKAVLVLDEWAADQDPFFRKKFYLEIIPELKKRGFTIFAITHDDAYYHTADRLFKMEYGQLTDKTSFIKEHVSLTL